MLIPFHPGKVLLRYQRCAKIKGGVCYKISRSNLNLGMKTFAGYLKSFHCMEDG